MIINETQCCLNMHLVVIIAAFTYGNDGVYKEGNTVTFPIIGDKIYYR